jgi:ABC-type antimicrobial peptide transport system permease subunit
MSLADTKEAIGMVVDTLRINKPRSGRTKLGIMIGVTTVILISSVINSLTDNVNDLKLLSRDSRGDRPFSIPISSILASCYVSTASLESLKWRLLWMIVVAS